MKKNALIFSLILSITGSSIPLAAYEKQQVLTIAVGEMPFLFSGVPEDSGAYNVLFDTVKQQMTVPYKLLYVPVARADIVFINGQVDCLTPASTAKMAEKHKLIASQPYNYVTAYIYNSTSEPSISSLHDLDKKIVAIQRGFTYGGKNFGENISVIAVGTINQSIEMLLKGRIDAFVGYESDVVNAFKEYDSSLIHTNKAFIVHSQSENIVCYKSKVTEQFIQQFDASLHLLKSSGQHKQIMAY
ncbi:substrate-binding periplasmic protein [Colwelliaceae bacterium 6471]